ncbi:MAG: sporulation protein [Oscillospiraceae bacterium]|nr:sporulation protein [Oscillospiraceae bacterium]
MTNAKRRLFSDTLLYTGLILSVLALIAFPRESAAAARNGLKLGTGVLLPSLFPFFVISSLMIGTGAAYRLGKVLSPFLGRLLGTGNAGSSAFVIGLLGGYPMGAKTVAELYEKGSVSKSEAERLLAFANNSGPAFILGACGGGVFESARAGFLLLFVHVLSAVIVGIMFRGGSHTDSVKTVPAESYPFPAAFVKAVKNSVRSIFDICGLIIFFEVMSALLEKTGLLPGGIVGTVLRGVMELTSGITGLAGIDHIISLPAAAFLSGWGGLCVHCQALSFALASGLKTGRYFAGKLLHGIIAAALTIMICLIIKC